MKAKFLVPVAALAASIAAEHSQAAISQNVNGADPRAQTDTALSDAVSNLSSPRDLNVKSNGDAFKFVLRPAENGQLMAWHSSHSSHASHSSHYSHRSSSY